MAWEVVVRLPTKSLMRFKCVSKYWHKIIPDPLFVKSYKGGFRGLLISHYLMCFVPNYGPDLEVHGAANTSFVHGDCFIKDPEEKMHSNNIRGCYRLLLEQKYIDNYYCSDYRVTNTEKGLFVFYTDDAFTLCNIATHELLDLPIKSPAENLIGSDCYLAFDPVGQVYKLLRFSSDINDIDGANSFTSLRICTIGGKEKDFNWRSIVAPQRTWDLSMQNICINGILYLMQCGTNDYNKLLVALDLSTKTTAPRFVPPPAQLILRPDDYSGMEWVELVQVGGSLGLINLTSGTSIIWILKDNETWTKCQSMDLTGIPGFTLSYVGTLPTGEVLLVRRKRVSGRADRCKMRRKIPLPVYKYDHIRNKLFNWTELDIPFFHSGREEACYMCYHEDNILPLDSLITR